MRVPICSCPRFGHCRCISACSRPALEIRMPAPPARLLACSSSWPLRAPRAPRPTVPSTPPSPATAGTSGIRRSRPASRSRTSRCGRTDSSRSPAASSPIASRDALSCAADRQRRRRHLRQPHLRSRRRQQQRRQRRRRPVGQPDGDRRRGAGSGGRPGLGGDGHADDLGERPRRHASTAARERSSSARPTTSAPRR